MAQFAFLGIYLPSLPPSLLLLLLYFLLPDITLSPGVGRRWQAYRAMFSVFLQYAYSSLSTPIKPITTLHKNVTISRSITFTSFMFFYCCYRHKRLILPGDCRKRTYPAWQPQGTSNKHKAERDLHPAEDDHHADNDVRAVSHFSTLHGTYFRRSLNARSSIGHSRA